MQTHFTAEQLADPATANANAILRACVHCGFCTATCPSYQVLGDELDSPRGRIYLIKEMLESGRPADEKVVKHLDRCLTCLACTSTCPSGVDYAHLIDHARHHVEESYRRPLADRLLRGVLAQILPYPGRFRWAMVAAKLARPLRRLMPDPRLRAMLEMTPKQVPPVSRNDDPQVFAAKGPRRLRVALLTGCAQRALNTDINDATLRLLTRLGCEVVVPQGLGCCGALTQHMGRRAQTEGFARATIAAFMAEVRGGGLDAVVINTSGCGTTLKDYGHMFADDPALAADAAQISALAKDVTELLARPELASAAQELALQRGSSSDFVALRVAYHAACSLQHGQQIKTTPKDLLRGAGFEVVEPQDSHLCCGSAGTYNLLQPKIAAELKRRKIATLEAKAPQVIAAGNIGCMMQIGSGSTVPVVHSVELLDWACGGPKPPALLIAD